MRVVSILCAARKSVYHAMDAVEVYDARRDALTFSGGTPIVAHPPCRGWSAKCRHQAKPEPGEMDLGLWCCDRLRDCGGVLEQPAWSHLFAAGRLPAPLHDDGDLWTVQVEQYWWGFPTPKPTWLCFCGVDPADVELPFRLRARGSRKANRYDAWSKLTAKKRSATPIAFAEWLVAIARVTSRTFPGSS